MKTPLQKKSSTQTIKKRFDQDVERFSNLDSGQKAIIDAPLMLDLISQLSIRIVPHAKNLLDIGCGAGNNTIKILREKSKINCDLVDLSLPMLNRAKERVVKEGPGLVKIFQGDFRIVDLPKNHYDIVVAAAVLHHLRDDKDWFDAISNIYAWLKPYGALFVSDMVFHKDEAVHKVMWDRYATYLIELGGEKYKDEVFDYIDVEDSPRDLIFQIELMRRVGFSTIDILHKNSCFAAYVAIK